MKDNMYLDKEYGFGEIIATLLDCYNIVKLGQAIPSEFLTVNGIEKLVKEELLPREVATFLYNLMCK